MADERGVESEVQPKFSRTCSRNLRLARVWKQELGSLDLGNKEGLFENFEFVLLWW